MARSVIRILFVCTGNICRSPTAEGVFRHLAEKAGLSDAFVIESAGTDAYHAGDAPDLRAIKTARKRGVDIASQRARQVRAEDFRAFDYIFAMDGGHLRELKSRAPEGATARIAMFLSSTAPDVPDPWYGGEEDFEEVFDLVHEGAEALLRKLREEHGL